MMTDLDEYKTRKISKTIGEICNSTRDGGYAIAEACYALAYKARKIDSQIKANQMNLNKNRC